MLESRLFSKISISKQENYLTIDLEETLTDTELTELKSLVLTRVSKNSAAGVVLNLEKLTVIDSFATKVLRDLAHTIAYLERPMILVGIRDEVAEVMKRQGLQLTDGLMERKNISEAISCLKGYPFRYH